MLNFERPLALPCHEELSSQEPPEAAVYRDRQASLLKQPLDEPWPLKVGPLKQGPQEGWERCIDIREDE